MHLITVAEADKHKITAVLLVGAQLRNQTPNPTGSLCVKNCYEKVKIHYSDLLHGLHATVQLYVQRMKGLQNLVKKIRKPESAILERTAKRIKPYQRSHSLLYLYGRCFLQHPTLNINQGKSSKMLWASVALSLLQACIILSQFLSCMFYSCNTCIEG